MFKDYVINQVNQVYKDPLTMEAWLKTFVNTLAHCPQGMVSQGKSSDMHGFTKTILKDIQVSFKRKTQVCLSNERHYSVFRWKDIRVSFKREIKFKGWIFDIEVLKTLL